MDLQALKVENFRSIEDSGWVSIDDLTCFIGKNESGKTAFMNAVEQINPRFGSPDYTPYKDYPRNKWPIYKRNHDAEPALIASAKFELEDEDIVEIESREYSGIIGDTEAIYKRYLDDSEEWELEIEEASLVQGLVPDRGLHDKTETKLLGSDSISELKANIRESTSDDDALEELENKISGEYLEGLQKRIGRNHLKAKVPSFHYIGEYSIMNDTVSINQLIKDKNNNNLDESDEVFMSLLSVANLDLQELRDNPDWRKIRTELQAASGRVTEDLLNYWTQNQNLRFSFDRNEAKQEGPSDYNSGKIVDVTVENSDGVEVGFDQRSQGFRWFFSSFCQFRDIRDSDEDLVLLLDEPGLHLHAKAQQDFLDFLDQELSAEHIVAYATHSPFMIDPRNLNRSKMVMADPEGQTNISDDVMATDEATRLPLQNVFEFDLVDTLLIRPQTLLVEGKSDHAYLYAISNILEKRGRTGLDKSWTVIPVGSGSNVPTFVSLFGANDLDLGVLLDGDSGYNQRKEDITSKGVMSDEHIRSTSDFVDQNYSDIEDLFSEDFYLELVNQTYQAELAQGPHPVGEIVASDFKNENPRVVKRLEKYFERQHINEGNFEHFAPAEYLQQNLERLREEIDPESLNNFEELFEDFNTYLEEF
ncbi:AAA family ATPase [Halopenitus salinus]|uniref:AAA family ATPase n=1 Tax=Halopenitus salinus TaxID=1198295 RepID=A0ABD5UWI8_9EURY